MTASEDLWGLTTFFNPSQSELRLSLLKRCAEGVRRQGLKLLITELAFGDDPHVLDNSYCDRLIRLRGQSVIWQKERLLNIAIGHLPDSCTRVAWLDADIVFENPDWVSLTSDMLDTFPVVQPFHQGFLLRRGEDAPAIDATHGACEGQWMYGMAYAMSMVEDRQSALRYYSEHGLCGLAWAARRDLIEQHGFYDRRIDGGGDLTMAHAVFGNIENWRRGHWESQTLSPALLEDIVSWGSAFDADLRQRVGCTPGRLFHLWHGDYTTRQYDERAKWLGEHDFDPATDLALDDNGLWQWASKKPTLHGLLAGLFSWRPEDG